MPNKSSKTHPVSFRMDNMDYALIQDLLKSSPRQQARTVGEYSKMVVHSFLHRHDKDSTERQEKAAIPKLMKAMGNTPKLPANMPKPQFAAYPFIHYSSKRRLELLDPKLRGEASHGSEAKKIANGYLLTPASYAYKPEDRPEVSVTSTAPYPYIGQLTGRILPMESSTALELFEEATKRVYTGTDKTMQTEAFLKLVKTQGYQAIDRQDTFGYMILVPTPIIEISDNVLSEMIHQLNTTGGSTFNLSSGNLAHTKGYSISIYEKQTFITDEATIQNLREYILKHAAALVIPQNNIGTWQENDKIYFDIAVTYKGTESQAIAVGKMYNQLAIFDLKNMKEIRCQ